MIQTFTYVIAHALEDAAQVTEAAATHIIQLSKLHQALRGADITATPTHITISLRIAASDRWRVSNSARVIATALIRSMKLDIHTAELINVQTATSARSFTKEQGRNPNHTPRGTKNKPEAS